LLRTSGLNFLSAWGSMERAWIYGETWVALDNKVTLLHEIGHSKQWIEQPGWFDKDYQSETKKVMSKQGAQDSDPKLKDVSAKKIFAKAKAMQLKTAKGRG
jgi:hypothetical protein